MLRKREVKGDSLLGGFGDVKPSVRLANLSIGADTHRSRFSLRVKICSIEGDCQLKVHIPQAL
jgi:hypothetical protein